MTGTPSPGVARGCQVIIEVAPVEATKVANAVGNGTDAPVVVCQSEKVWTMAKLWPIPPIRFVMAALGAPGTGAGCT